MTIKSLETLVQEIKTTVDSINKIYTTKIQWKQLDLQRRKSIEDLKDLFISLEDKVDKIEVPMIDLSAYATDLTVNRLDLIRSSEIETLKTGLESLQDQLDSIDVSDDQDLDSYVTKLEWKQLDLIRHGVISNMLESVLSMETTLAFLENSLSAAEVKANKGVPLGYPSLDAEGFILQSQLPPLTADNIDWDDVYNTPATYEPSDHEHDIDGGEF